MTEKEIPPLGNCPKCGAKLFRECWEGWGWDRAVCSNWRCNYQHELDVMTGHDSDGSVWQVKRKEEK